MSQQKEDVSIDEKEINVNQDQDVQDTVVSDDDVIDYSVKPEFYDPNLDDKDQSWIQKKRKGQYSDAVLSCPACFTTLCLECQRYLDQLISCILCTFVVRRMWFFRFLRYFKPYPWEVYCVPVTIIANLGAHYSLFLRHEKYVTQYRAVFVVNCKIKKGQVSEEGSLKRKRVKKGGSADNESSSPVCCSVCETEVGVIDADEVYHFYNVLPSEC